MNLGKAEVKIDVANELGCRLDDMLEGAQKELYRVEGSIRAFQAMGQAIDGLMKIVDQEMDEGKFDLDGAAHIKRFVKRAHQMTINLTLQSENNRFMQMGRIQGAEMSVQVTKKFKDDEISKVATLQKALEENRAKSANGSHEMVADDGPRPVATRPGASIKERRLAEETVLTSPAEPLVEAPEAPVEAAPLEATEAVKAPKAKTAPGSKSTAWRSKNKSKRA